MNTPESPRRSLPVTATPPANQGPPTVRTDAGPSDAGPSDAGHRVTVYAAVGAQPFFDQLVERFYSRVAEDDVLLALYPEQKDLGPARERLALFLGQYWGGPTTYSEQRGHPRLRMRHAPFAIGERERDHWLRAMNEALAETMPETPLDEELRDEVGRQMAEYFAMAAQHLVNHPG